MAMPEASTSGESEGQREIRVSPLEHVERILLQVKWHLWHSEPKDSGGLYHHGAAESLVEDSIGAVREARVKEDLALIRPTDSTASRGKA